MLLTIMKQGGRTHPLLKLDYLCGSQSRYPTANTQIPAPLRHFPLADQSEAGVHSAFTSVVLTRSARLIPEKDFTFPFRVAKDIATIEQKAIPTLRSFFFIINCF
jgi:hypothetical protein